MKVVEPQKCLDINAVNVSPSPTWGRIKKGIETGPGSNNLKSSPLPMLLAELLIMIGKYL